MEPPRTSWEQQAYQQQAQQQAQQEQYEAQGAVLRSSSQSVEGPASSFPPASPEDDSPLFQTDDFRIWCMKVIPCTKRFVHDWTVCPFAHAGEKAVRRDPRLVNYTGIACPDMKKTGNCIRGDRCPYAHNVFEYWLHPTRYRTQLCNDGPTCKRSICFFAHSLEQLRVPACKPYVSPEALARASLEAIQQNPHPLAQQLPNPVTAAQQQQQAAMMAMTGPPAHLRRGPPQQQQHHAQQQYYHSSLGPPNHSAPSSLAASAAPFVPGGGPQRSLHMGMPPPQRSYDFHGLPNSANSMSLEPAGHSIGGGYRPGQQPHSAPEYAAPPAAAAAAGAQPRPAAGVPCAVDLGRGAYDGSAAQHMGFHQFQTQAPAVPTRLSHHSDSGDRSTSPAASGGGSGSGGGSAPRSGKATPDIPTMHSADSLPSMASADGLAHSLASLKIAMTQQQLAAAAGSNHEVVISTLHQILKEAAAQQTPGAAGAGLPGKSPPPSPALPSSANAMPNSGNALPNSGNSGAGHRAPYFIQDSLGPVPLPSSGSSSSGASSGRLSGPLPPAGSVRAPTAGRSPLKGLAPEMYSPDTVAAFQAASAAAAAGYFAVHQVAGGEGELSSLEEAEQQLSAQLSTQTYSASHASSALSQLSGLASAANSAPNSASASGQAPVMARPLSSGQLVSIGGALAHAIGE